MKDSTCDAVDGRCACVASDLFALLGRTYAMDVVCVVATHESVRFGEIRDHLPDASTSTLSTRLSELTSAGLLEREQYDEIPPRVEYRLTADGRELGDRLGPLAEWAASYKDGTATESASTAE